MFNSFIHIAETIQNTGRISGIIAMEIVMSLTAERVVVATIKQYLRRTVLGPLEVS